MKNLGRANFLMIINAVIHRGTYNPEQIFCWFEERLYMNEVDTIYKFLKWVHEGKGNRNFDFNNYEERFQEFLNDVKFHALEHEY